MPGVLCLLEQDARKMRDHRRYDRSAAKDPERRCGDLELSYTDVGETVQIVLGKDGHTVLSENLVRKTEKGQGILCCEYALVFFVQVSESLVFLKKFKPQSLGFVV